MAYAVGLPGRHGQAGREGLKRDMGGLVLTVGMFGLAGFFAAVAVARLRRRGQPVLAGIGVSWSGLAPLDLLAGLAIGTLAMGGLAIAELTLGVLSLSPVTSPPALGWPALDRLAHALFEEVLFRGLLVTGILLVFGKRRVLAVLLSAIVFGLSHAANPGASPLSLLSSSLGGAVYAIAFLGSGSIWLPLGLHFAWNFAQGPLLGLTVSGKAAPGLLQAVDHGPTLISGGVYGPEAGLVGLAARIATMVGVLAWFRLRPGRSGAKVPLDLN